MNTSFIRLPLLSRRSIREKEEALRILQLQPRWRPRSTNNKMMSTPDISKMTQTVVLCRTSRSTPPPIPFAPSIMRMAKQKHHYLTHSACTLRLWGRSFSSINSKSSSKTNRTVSEILCRCQVLRTEPVPLPSSNHNNEEHIPSPT